MAPRPPIESISSSIDIVGVEGPGEGVRAELDPETTLQIGRGLRGLEVPDPHVSLQHAKIEWFQDHYVLTDLDSATGTWLEGEKIPKDKPQRLVVGNRFRVGDTVFELVERHAHWRRAAELVAFAAMALVLVGAILWLLIPNRDLEVAMLWHEPIHQGDEAKRVLDLDQVYLRLRGIDPLSLRIRRVTDYDTDGMDEVWLTGPEHEHVITFDPDGRWRHLGRLPLGCADVKNARALGLPLLECGQETWAMLGGETYEPMAMDGVVVWGVPRESWEKPGFAPSELVRPWTLNLRRSTAFAGFLAMNGVDEAVHYLLCEEAVPGVPPTVLTAGDELRELSQGCRGLTEVDGLELESVRAVAFTVAGHEALLDDMRTHLAGSPDGVFLDGSDVPLVEAWAAEPELAGTATLDFVASEHFFSPLAKEALLERRRQLPSDREPMPRVTTATLVSSGTVHLDPPGCLALEVETGAWSCVFAQGCLEGSTFATLREVGCGEPRVLLEAPYAGGAWDATVEGVDVRVHLDGGRLGEGFDVHRARVAWRRSVGGD